VDGTRVEIAGGGHAPGSDEESALVGRAQSTDGAGDFWATDRDMRWTSAPAEASTQPHVLGAAKDAEPLSIPLRPAFPAKLADAGAGGGDVPPDYECYDPIVEIDSGGAINLMSAGSGRRLRTRECVKVAPESLVLAETSTNILNVAALEADHPELCPLLSLTHDIHAFERLFLDTTTPDPRRPLSRGMDKHLDDLKKFDIIDTSAAHTTALGLLVVVWCTLFLVPKKIKTLGRLVIDARPINRRQRRPPPMGLPRINDVIRRILGWEVASSCDGKSFFYQFPLVPEVARYFRTRIAGRRGSIIEGVLKRLPMGWSFSPAIAQRVGNALTWLLGLAWVDDFIIGGTRDDYDDIRTEFKRRLHRYNIEVDNELLEPTTRLIALGLEFDLIEKRYRVSPAWVEKRQARWGELSDLIAADTATFRNIFELYGSLIWADFVCEQPLWMRAEALAALQALAKAVNGQYDTPCSFPDYARANLKDWIVDIVANPWRTPPQKLNVATVEHFLFSDASSTAGAWIRIFKNDVVDGAQWHHQHDLHIYMHELEAMCAAAQAAPDAENSLHVVDNSAVVGSAVRGHSSSYKANVALRSTFGPRKPWTIWASTDRQLADPYTRGVKIPTHPTPLSPQQHQVLATLDAQGQPDSKRNMPLAA
jgi:hypothetical protein